MTTLFVILGLALIGGAIYRWRGGLTNQDGSQSLSAPRFIRLGLWAAPMGLMVGLAFDMSVVGFVVAFWMFVGASFGHAKWQDLGMMGGDAWSDLRGLAWSGFLMAGPFGVLSKPLAYFIGWLGYEMDFQDKHHWLRWGTEVGEFLTGFFIYGSMTAAILIFA